MKQMKDRPILFSAPMVRALLDGSKTQTRRAFNDRTKFAFDCAARIGEVSFFLEQDELGKNDLGYVLDFCPYGKVGDRLWVRETWRGVVQINNPYNESYKEAVAKYIPDQEHCKRLEYLASQKDDNDPWRPSIHMPRWASRINLEITGVRVERLNDISESDAKAEGCDNSKSEAAILAGWYEKPVRAYQRLWEQINGAGSWAENPWVWVVEFKRLAESAL